MNTIVIDDPLIYQRGELYAKAKHSSLKELVNQYVATLAAQAFPFIEHQQTSVPFTQTEEFKKAMEYMDTFVISDPSIKIPVDEDGKGAVTRMKYESKL